jgi:hypothetical protein
MQHSDPAASVRDSHGGRECEEQDNVYAVMDCDLAKHVSPTLRVPGQAKHPVPPQRLFTQ